MIEFKNICKDFDQGSKKIQVLKDFSFLLEGEGLFAIVGKSGSGKSTFLSLLAGLDKPSSGEIFFDGKCISNLSEQELTEFRAKNIGIVFQSFHLIEQFTALENILLPLEILKTEGAQEKALAMIEMVGLSDRMNHFPAQLSGGECQRVAIARAAVTNPRILLADEPSGNLDPETGDRVMGTLFDTAKKLGQTLILVTHDMELARKCDKVFEIKNQGLELI